MNIKQLNFIFEILQKEQNSKYHKKEIFKFKVNRIILIPTLSKIESYKTYDLISNIVIDFLFEEIEYVAEIIFELIDKFNAKQNSFEFDSISYLGNYILFYLIIL